MASGFLQRLKGDLYLAYRAVLAHPLRRLVHRDERSGLQRFLANYGPEGLVPTHPDEQAILRGASRCIHCGLCDAFDPTLSSRPRELQDGASLVPLQYARATPDLIHAGRALEQLTDEALQSAEAVCPTRVPLRQIVVHLLRKRAEVERARASDGPGE